jgi:hypothetical protein
MFGKHGELTGHQSGIGFTIAGGDVRVYPKDANKLVTAGRDLGTAYRALAPSLERCIVSIEQSQE